MNKRQQEAFELFREENGAPTSSEKVPEAAYRKYQSVFPPTLLEFWKADGWAGYQNGLWWLVNPESWDRTVHAWLAETPFSAVDRYHAVARSAFGSIYAWGEKFGQYVVIDCPNNYVLALRDEFEVHESNPDLAMGTLLSRLSRKSADIQDDAGNSLFDLALEKFGALDQSEMFGFEPALVLGGDADIGKIVKLRADVHLAMLRQFEAPQVPGFEDLMGLEA